MRQGCRNAGDSPAEARNARVSTYMLKTQILDLLPFGIIVLAPGAKITYMNRCASDLLRTCEEVSLSQGVLGLRSLAHNRVLADAISELTNGSNAGPIGFSIARTGLHPVSVVLTKLAPRPGNAAGRGSDPATPGSRPGKVLAVICDPDVPLHAPVPLLKQLFNFTRTEAAIATLILRYKDTHAIADELAITEDTVRKHLKSMFAKTHCKKQAELRHVLLLNPALLLFSTNQLE